MAQSNVSIVTHPVLKLRKSLLRIAIIRVACLLPDKVSLSGQSKELADKVCLDDKF